MICSVTIETMVLFGRVWVLVRVSVKVVLGKEMVEVEVVRDVIRLVAVIV